MTLLQLYLLFVAGILLSILVPVAIKWIREAREAMSRGTGDVIKKVFLFAKPYLLFGIGSLIIGFLLVLIFYSTGADAKNTTWFNAVLYGYAWDSTIQKLTQPGSSTQGDG